MTAAQLESMADDLGSHTALVVGTDVDDYGHPVVVMFPRIDISTTEGRRQMRLNCASLERITRVQLDRTWVMG